MPERAIGGRHVVFAWWRHPFNLYLRVGSRSIFLRQPEPASGN